jgi:hypothetical protein
MVSNHTINVSQRCDIYELLLSTFDDDIRVTFKAAKDDRSLRSFELSFEHFEKLIQFLQPKLIHVNLYEILDDVSAVMQATQSNLLVLIFKTLGKISIDIRWASIFIPFVQNFASRIYRLQCFARHLIEMNHLIPQLKLEVCQVDIFTENAG